MSERIKFMENFVSDNKQRRHPELLIPASSLEVLKVAVIFGADAVYIGGEAFGLRAKAKNFTLEEMKEGVEFAHEHNVKVYVTANILAHNRDLDGAYEYFEELKDVKPDALIISDPAIFTIAKEVLPDMEIHISTQANNTNYGTFNFWYKQGAKRVVTARELSLEEIKEIRRNIPDDLEIETFVHGAMCISYSGRCLLSSFMAGRDANQGACTHPCRWKYSVVEESRPGQYMPVYENERGTYIFNSKDLCMIEHIKELVESGIDSLKIEGRMKTALYVATVARTYRMALDDYKESEELYRSRLPFYKEEIAKCTYRQYTTGFFFGKPDENTQIYDSNTYIKEYTYLGIIGNEVDRSSIVKDDNVGVLYEIEQRNKFTVGEQIELMKPDGTNVEVTVMEIFDEDGNKMESAPHPKQKLFINLEIIVKCLEVLSLKTFMEPLSKEEEEYYLKRFKDGDKKAKEVLIERNLRLVAHVVKKYVSTDMDRGLEDMISVGTIGLIKAITSFNMEKGKLSTYAAKCIDNELLMMLRYDKKKSKEVSLYEPIGTDHEGNEISLFDIIESDEKSIESQCELQEDLIRLSDVINKELTPREYEIIKMRYGLMGEEEVTQREVARIMGISRSYVSRIEKRALEKLRRAIE